MNIYATEGKEDSYRILESLLYFSNRDFFRWGWLKSEKLYYTNRNGFLDPECGYFT